MLPKGGEMTDRETSRVLTTRKVSLAGQPDMENWIHFAKAAESAGIESVLTSFGNYEPDPLAIACALGQHTQKLKFIAAYRLGLMQPTLFIQQVNTLSTLIGGRIALNIIAGSSPAEQRGYGDFLDHDRRYARAEEFLEICNCFWQHQEEVNFDGEYYQVEGGRIHTPFLAPDRGSPELYIAGHSDCAEHLAVTQGSCWLRVIDTPEKLSPLVARVRERGIEVCLRMGIVCRPTRQQAIEAAEALQENGNVVKQVRSFLAKSDSQTLHDALALTDKAWLSETLWTGLVSSFGSSAMTVVGTPEEITKTFLEYKQIGVTQFIISGWPKLEEMMIFGREILPRIRQAEQAIQSEPVPL